MERVTVEHEAMRPAQEDGSLSVLQEELLKNMSSLACKTWKTLGELGL